MSKTIWVGAVAYNPKVVTIWEGMRRYFNEEAHLSVEVVLFQSYEAQVLACCASNQNLTDIFQQKRLASGYEDLLHAKLRRFTSDPPYTFEPEFPSRRRGRGTHAT